MMPKAAMWRRPMATGIITDLWWVVLGLLVVCRRFLMVAMARYHLFLMRV
jgi:hypothetical protein